MDDFIAARAQMALSLGFHIIFSCVGMVMPFLMAFAHWKYLKTNNEVYKGLTKAWSKGVAILFATGAVSGTMLSFELGLLWPGFMKHAGPIFGMPFSLEGTAFFIEAIAIGFFLYGWERFNKWFHWFCGFLVGVSGLASGILVVAANSWMNSPTGFDYINGQYLNIDPIKAMFNDAWFPQALHMTVAAFCATGFAVAGVHAFMIMRKRNIEFHTKAFRIAVGFALIGAFGAPLSGDVAAKSVAERQPIKLAAMEAHFETEKGASFVIGGIPDEEKEEVKYAVKIPKVLSFLVSNDFNSEVKGLKDFPRDEWPPIAVVHYAFQIMIFFGVVMIGIGAIYLYAFFFKKEWLSKHWLLKTFLIATPFGYIALEAGWTVTEVGRQPWIIYGVMRTIDAVTPMPGIQYSFYFFTAIFISLSLILVFLLKRQIQMVPKLYDPTDSQFNDKKQKIMIYVVIGFLWLSICLYIILGGADFGAGIVELFTHKKARNKTQEIMYESIAPVWEANHMWLIIAIVILFVGFPEIYTTMSTYLHIPLVLMLLGIIARGTAFTFRHYDAVKDNWQVLYTQIFYYASLLTPFFLGLIAAATVSHSINPDAVGFLDLYVFSWLNWFGVSVGLFTVALCAYLASIFSLRETRDKADLLLMIRKSKQTMIFVVITGILVFATAYISDIPLLMWVFSKPLGMMSIAFATVALLLILRALNRQKLLPVRALAGFQMVMILVAATYQHNPDIILLGNGQHLSLLEHMAPEKTIAALGWALMLGSLFILPFLFYLMASFSKLRK